MGPPPPDERLRAARRPWLLWLVAGPAAVVLLSTLVPLRLPEPHLPTRVLGRAVAIAPGARVGDLLERLEQLRYREIAAGEPRPGEYRRQGGVLRLHRRAFRELREPLPEALVELRVRERRVASIRDASGRRLREVRLDPPRIGTIQREEHVARTRVALTDLPEHLVDAVLVTEDRRFFTHRGLDERRMLGAALANLSAGRVVQGGSTLTQQLVKNVYSDAERTFGRKLREAWLALRVERAHSKEAILEAYLNTIYLGQQGPVSVRGVEAAASHYFGKSARDLSLAESALIAGMIRGPGYYSPFTRPEHALEQRDRVLGQLREARRISDDDYRAALAQPLGALPAAPRSVSAPYFVAHVLRELARRAPELHPEEETLVIHTPLDALLQHRAQEAVRRGLDRLEQDFPELAGSDAPLQAALVAIDPATGHVVAHVGGRDWGASQFDRVTQARRQPGSLFKPIVALAALAPDAEPSFTLASLLEDAPLELDTDDEEEGPWIPQNLGGEFRGFIPLREAVEDSVNVPIARLGLEIGPRRIVRTARRLGIRSPLRAVPSLALGASEVSPLEIAEAYAVFAAEGRRTAARVLDGVTDPEGATLLATRVHSQVAFDAARVALVTSVLEGAVDRGTGVGLRYAGFRGSVAGKTGTTNDTRDAWFVGYSPDLVAAVWVGFDDGRSLGLTGSRAALPIFADFFIAALGRDGGRPFERPPGLEEVRVNAESGLRTGFGCWGRRELFLDGTAPEESCGFWSGVFR